MIRALTFFQKYTDSAEVDTMAFLGYGVWPLLAFGGFLLLICMAFCLYLYRLRNLGYREQGFKLVSLQHPHKRMLSSFHLVSGIFITNARFSRCVQFKTSCHHSYETIIHIN